MCIVKSVHFAYKERRGRKMVGKRTYRGVGGGVVGLQGCVIGPVETIRGSCISYSELLQRKLNKQLRCETNTLNKT